MAYLISARQRKLLALLSRENMITGEVLASLLSVTSRTVRNEISSINSILGCSMIRSSGKGYSLDPQYFHLLREAQVYADEKSLRMLLIWNIFSNRFSNKAVDPSGAQRNSGGSGSLPASACEKRALLRRRGNRIRPAHFSEYHDSPGCSQRYLPYRDL